MTTQRVWRADDVCKALVTLGTATFPGLPVWDSVDLGAASQLQYLAIGYTVAGGDIPVRAERTETGYGGNVTEVGEVECALAVASGGGNAIADHRAKASGMLAELEAALRVDPTLGDVVDDASLGAAIHGQPVVNDRGSGYMLLFSVRYEAFL